MRIKILSALLLGLAVFAFSLPASAGRKLHVSSGQKVYVPIYSHVYQGPKSRPYNLSAYSPFAMWMPKTPSPLLPLNTSMMMGNWYRTTFKRQ